MKKILLLGALFAGFFAFAQAPQKMSYQSVIRDGGNILVSNGFVSVRISVLQGSASGPAQYIETHTVTTNMNGLASLSIGSGSVVSGSMSAIDWSAGPYFIKSETDPTGGSSYTIVGVSQMMSVPYALYAANSPAGSPGPEGPQGAVGNDGAAGADGAQGPVGNDGAAGADGAQGPVGNDGAAGADGVITVVPFNGDATSGPFTSGNYDFVGPTATITITSTSQKVFGTAVVPIATTTGTANVYLGLGYKLGTGVITNFVGGNFAIVQIGPTRTTSSATGYVTGLNPGVYTVGVVIRNITATAINNNDYVNGWIMVTN